MFTLLIILFVVVLLVVTLVLLLRVLLRLLLSILLLRTIITHIIIIPKRMSLAIIREAIMRGDILLRGGKAGDPTDDYPPLINGPPNKGHL